MKKTTFIHHVCLQSPNFNKSVEFYQSMFKSEIIHEWGEDGENDHAIMLLLEDELMLEIFDCQEELTDNGKWNHVAIQTENIIKSVEKSVLKGASIVIEPSYSDILKRDGSTYCLWFAYIQSPGGEIIEFIQETDAKS